MNGEQERRTADPVQDKGESGLAIADRNEAGGSPSPAPPPAPRQPEGVQPPLKANATAADLFWRLWANKLPFFSVCLGLSLSCLVLVNVLVALLPNKAGEVLLLTFVPAYGVSFWLLIIVIVLGVRQLKTGEERRGHPHGLREPVDREGQSFLFTKDGGMYRSDGFEAKYRWTADGQMKRYEDDDEQTVPFTIPTTHGRGVPHAG
jgi:hypothetical protein